MSTQVLEATILTMCWAIEYSVYFGYMSEESSICVERLMILMNFWRKKIGSILDALHFWNYRKGFSFLVFTSNDSLTEQNTKTVNIISFRFTTIYLHQCPEYNRHSHLHVLVPPWVFQLCNGLKIKWAITIENQFCKKRFIFLAICTVGSGRALHTFWPWKKCNEE